MQAPILKQGNFLIASVQAALTDTDLLDLRDRLAEQVGAYRSRGVIVDLTALDVMDSFATRTLRSIAQILRLRAPRLSSSACSRRWPLRWCSLASGWDV